MFDFLIVSLKSPIEHILRDIFSNIIEILLKILILLINIKKLIYLFKVFI